MDKCLEYNLSNILMNYFIEWDAILHKISCSIYCCFYFLGSYFYIAFLVGKLVQGGRFLCCSYPPLIQYPVMHIPWVY